MRTDIEAVLDAMPTATREQVEDVLRQALAHIARMRATLGIVVYETVTIPMPK